MISVSAETWTSLTCLTSHHYCHSSILDSLVDQKSTHSAPSVIYSYDTIMHGFSASLTPGELKQLENSPGFVSAFHDRPADFLGLSRIWPESESFMDDGISANIPKKWNKS